MPPRAGRALALVCVLAAASPAAVRAQSLPPYSVMNPVASSRSGLETAPYRDPAPGWRLVAMADYANLIEYVQGATSSEIIDLELMRLDLTVYRDFGPRAFVFGGTSFNGAYDGFLDGFLNWYHDFTGLEVAGRRDRPKNQYLYAFTFPDGFSQTRPNPGEWLGDLRLGGGHRHTAHWQTSGWITVPTGEGQTGFRRGTVTLNAVTTLRAPFARRFTYEGSLGFGWSGRTGDLADYQRTTFALVSSGLRARVVGPFHLYTNIVYHSPYYREAGLPGFDNRELTIDLGGIFRFARGPEWILGLTEDLSPSGPAIDVDFRIGARW